MITLTQISISYLVGVLSAFIFVYIYFFPIIKKGLLENESMNGSKCKEVKGQLVFIRVLVLMALTLVFISLMVIGGTIFT